MIRFLSVVVAGMAMVLVLNAHPLAVDFANMALILLLVDKLT